MKLKNSKALVLLSMKYVIIRYKIQCVKLLEANAQENNVKLSVILYTFWINYKLDLHCGRW